MAEEQKQEPFNFENLTTALGNADMSDSESMGKLLGGMFTQMSSAFMEPGPDGEPKSSDEIIRTLLGQDASEKVLREMAIRDFLESSMQENTLKEAVRMTKEKFELPDDYETELKITIKFSTHDAKQSVPDID